MTFGPWVIDGACVSHKWQEDDDDHYHNGCGIDDRFSSIDRLESAGVLLNDVEVLPVIQSVGVAALLVAENVAKVVLNRCH